MKILLAEDEPVSRLILEKLVAKWGYEVQVVTDGEEAWCILQGEDAPKLVILDWMMPGRDGLQICRDLRARTEAPYVYILLLTAKAQKQDIIRGLEAGADDYVTKPFDSEELRVRLRAGRRILDFQESLLTARQAAQHPSTVDFLTGLPNREAILGLLRREIARHPRGGTPVSVVLVNIDRFRHLPNTYGPAAGDAVLREITRRIRSTVRPYDSIGRYGEKEFLIVAPGCDAHGALSLAERIRAVINGLPVDVLVDTIRLTASLGVSTSEEVQDPAMLLRAVEMAVFQAKRAGRNRFELASGTEGRSGAVLDGSLRVASSGSLACV